MSTSLEPAGPRALERMRAESQRIGAALPPPRPGPAEGWRRRRDRLVALARSGELARRLVLGAPLAAIGFAIFAFGGVYGWAYGLAYLLIFTALGAWSVQCWRGVWRARWQPVYAPLLAFAVLALLQASFGFSVVAAATDTALLHLGAGMAAFVLVSQLYKGATDAAVVIAGFTWLTAALALLAIMQILTASTGIYWHFTYAYASPAGSFVNKNNFAGCMEMLIPVACAGVYRHRHEDWLHLLPWALAPGLGVAAMVLAASRGGMLALAAEAAAALGLYLLSRRRRPRVARHFPLGRSRWSLEGGLRLPAGDARSARSISKRPGSVARPASHASSHRTRWAWLLICVAAAAVLIAAVGTQRLSHRLDASALHGPSIEQRHLLNLSSLAMFRARPVAGWGLGTWAEVYPVYARFDDGSSYAYAHDDYLQLLAETGVAGAACGLAFWGLWGWDFAGQLRRRRAARASSTAAYLALAAAIAVAGMLAHSWVDFNLHIPANLLLFFVLLALASGHVKDPGVKDRFA